MNTEQDDKKLHSLFAELKREELKRVPAFGSILNMRREVLPVFRPALIAAAAAVLVVVATTLAVYQLKAHWSAGESQKWAALSNWQAATDVLLLATTMPWENQGSTSLDAWLDESWPNPSSITIPETKGGSYEQES